MCRGIIRYFFLANEANVGTFDESKSLIVEDVGAVCRALKVGVKGYPDGLVAGQPHDREDRSRRNDLKVFRAQAHFPENQVL